MPSSKILLGSARRARFVLKWHRLGIQGCMQIDNLRSPFGYRPLDAFECTESLPFLRLAISACLFFSSPHLRCTADSSAALTATAQVRFLIHLSPCSTPLQPSQHPSRVHVDLTLRSVIQGRNFTIQAFQTPPNRTRFAKWIQKAADVALNNATICLVLGKVTNYKPRP
jgi:hypothetical protein